MKLRILFSAHGLPESIVKSGDPYQWQVEQAVAAVVGQLGDARARPVVCYQSRVTPQKWLGPGTEVELERAAHDKVAVLVCPIAFVSEHSETLVELDVEYREEAERLGVPGYFRVPAQNSDPGFIAALRGLVRARRGPGSRTLCSFAGGRQCPKAFGDCPHAKAKARSRNWRDACPNRLGAPPAAVLFDCDGVLADTEGLVNRHRRRRPDRTRLAAFGRAGAGDLPRHGAARTCCR